MGKPPWRRPEPCLSLKVAPERQPLGPGQHLLWGPGLPCASVPALAAPSATWAALVSRAGKEQSLSTSASLILRKPGHVAPPTGWWQPRAVLCLG